MQKIKEMQLQENSKSPHIPVMLNEIVEIISPKEGGVYLDCTFGYGGYSKAILDAEHNCKIIAIDKDPEVKKRAEFFSSNYGKRFDFRLGSFAEIALTMQQEGQIFDGIMLDLGMSSMQLDSPFRGFSFSKNAPLDMRMNNSKGITAEQFLANASASEITKVIEEFGEERRAKTIANYIIELRKENKLIKTSFELRDIVHKALGRSKTGKIDSATKIFQALRIYVNNELEELQFFLDKSLNILSEQGKIAVVSFHGLEDRLVKIFFKQNIFKKPKNIYASLTNKEEEKQNNQKYYLNPLSKKPLTPSREEIKINPRCRSAKLRAAIKIYGGNKI